MKKEKNPINIIFAAFGAVLLAVIPLRCYQFIKILEPRTGFYDKTDWSVWVLYALLILAGASFAAAAFASKKKFVYDTAPAKSTAIALASFMLALTMFISSVAQYKSALSIISDGSTMIYGSESIGYFKTGAAARMLEGVCAIVCAVFFVIFGYGHISGKSRAADNKLMALFPVLWCIFRLMHRFMRTINFLNVSDLLYELVMCVMLMMFFMAFAQLNSGIGSKEIAWKLVGYGVPAALFCLLCFLPRFIMLITGRSELLCSESPIEWCDLGCAVFIITLIIGHVGVISQSTETPANTSGSEAES